MNRRGNAYVFCFSLWVMLFCVYVQGLAMEDRPKGRLKGEECSESQMSAAKAKYCAGVDLLNYEMRRVAFQKAVDLCPSYAEAHVNLADAFEHLGLSKKKADEKSLVESNKLLDEAVKHYSRAIELRPELMAPKIGLGDVYMALGCYPLAVENYRRALKLRPGMSNVESRLKEAERRIRPSSEGVKKEAEIISEVKDANLRDMYKTMGFQVFVVSDAARQTFNNILFEPWSSRIRAGDPIKQLNEIGKALTSQELSSFRFVIEGHANTVGEFEPNMKLSNNRARAVKEYLAKNFKVDPRRIMTQGFGFTRPKFNPGTDARNRRVEVVFFNEDLKK
ncbi:MAG: OmpA family protein [Desulfomonilaceae bacterium]